MNMYKVKDIVKVLTECQQIGLDGNVIGAIPEEVREHIEAEVNSYLQKEPTYYPGEAVDWKNRNLAGNVREKEYVWHV